MQLALDEARTSPPAGTEVLSQGDDKFMIWLAYSLHYQVPRRPQAHTRDSVQITASWDDVFSALGPLMLDESPEEALEHQVNDWGKTEHIEDVKEDVLRVAGFDGDSSTVKISGYTAKISSHDFHTILIQLMAVGLITKSERRRSVTDKGTYWTLTPYGRTRLIQLRAVRRAIAGTPDPLPDPAQ